MSETRTIKVKKTLRDKLLFLSEKFDQLNTGATGDEFWIGTASSGGYDWGQQDFGVDKQGNLLACYQSGCSCYGPEQPTGDHKYDLRKPIVLSDEDDYYGVFTKAFDDLEATTKTLYKVLTNKNVSPKEIIGLTNAEVRRAVVELVGYEKIVGDAQVLDESTDGRLLKIPLQEDEDIVLVHVKDPSTDREYFLRVPPKTKTAKEARAWTFGFEAADFDLERET